MPLCNLTDASLQVISTIILHKHTHTHIPMCPPMHVEVRVPTHTYYNWKIYYLTTIYTFHLTN